MIHTKQYTDADITREVTAAIPEVKEGIKNSGLDPTFLRNIFQEVVKGKYPLKNIAFLLWIETVN